MIWNPVVFVRGLSPTAREQQRLARRWAKAVQASPGLDADVIRLGGILSPEAGYFEDSGPVPTASPIDIALRQGRREMALELLALMKVDPEELSLKLETDADV